MSEAGFLLIALAIVAPDLVMVLFIIAGIVLASLFAMGLIIGGGISIFMLIKNGVIPPLLEASSNYPTTMAGVVMGILVLAVVVWVKRRTIFHSSTKLENEPEVIDNIV